MSTPQQETRIAEIRQEIADLEAVFDALAEWTAANIAKRDALNTELTALTTPPPPPVPTTPAEFYGPVGEWPDELAWAMSSAVATVVLVGPSWTEIAKAEAANRVGPTIIAVTPGKLGGYGAGSTRTPVLSGVRRPDNAPLLIMAAEGFGSVTASASWRLDKLRNVGFAHFDMWPYGYVATDVENFVFTRSTVKPANVSTQTLSSGIVMHELVRLEPVNEDSDAWAIRNGDKRVNAVTENVSVRRCLVLGAYKAATSNAHCDTIQISGPGKFRHLVVELSLIPASSNHAMIFTDSTDDVEIRKCAIIGGQPREDRFPDAPDRYQGAGGIALNAKPTNLRIYDSLITGRVISQPVVSENVRTSANMTKEWWAEHAPTRAREELVKIWAKNHPLAG